MNDEAPAYPVNSLQLYRFIDHVALAVYDGAQSPEEAGEIPIVKTANNFTKTSGKASARKQAADSGCRQELEAIVR